MSAYPAWVTPHVSHLVRRGEHVSTVLFPQVSVSRANPDLVTVLVHNAAEAALAAAPYTAGEQNPNESPT